ncbi:MAG: carbohydrate-binding family 9-like protein [Opitutaceae bacterium]|nr:carbohydrate-binding family 9-like protein [Opitutaceae bacterium]
MTLFRRGRLPCLTLAFIAFSAAAAEPSQFSAWREKMSPIVPLTYVARHTATPIVIDGRIDDTAWAAAPWTADFTDIEGDAKPKPRFRTRAKILWDDQFLYIAADLEEPHVWGKLTQHDAVIFHDPDFEVFLDPDGDTHNYFEFELNALNTGWDLFLPKPYMDGGKARNDWEIPGLKTAVHIRGTLNDPGDTDTGWTLEMAFPWTAFTPPGGTSAISPQAPAEGAVWRMNFSRVEWQITTAGGRYEKIPKTPEDNWVWSPQGVIDMHRPEMWGRLLFTRRPGGEPVVVPPVAGHMARRVALDLYYAQRDFFKTHRRWATTLAELGWPVPAGTEPPAFAATAEGYEFSVPFNEGPRPRKWTIRQDRRLTLD